MINCSVRRSPNPIAAARKAGEFRWKRRRNRRTCSARDPASWGPEQSSGDGLTPSTAKVHCDSEISEWGICAGYASAAGFGPGVWVPERLSASAVSGEKAGPACARPVLGPGTPGVRINSGILMSSRRVSKSFRYPFRPAARHPSSPDPSVFSRCFACSVISRKTNRRRYGPAPVDRIRRAGEPQGIRCGCSRALHPLSSGVLLLSAKGAPSE